MDFGTLGRCNRIQVSGVVNIIVIRITKSTTIIVNNNIFEATFPCLVASHDVCEPMSNVFIINKEYAVE